MNPALSKRSSGPQGYWQRSHSFSPIQSSLCLKCKKLISRGKLETYGIRSWNGGRVSLIRGGMVDGPQEGEKYEYLWMIGVSKDFNSYYPTG